MICQNYALATQNYDGIWDLPLIAGRSATRNNTSQFLATGQMVEWLALSLPKDRLEDARLAKSVEYLIGMLNSPNYRGRFPLRPPGACGNGTRRPCTGGL